MNISELFVWFIFYSFLGWVWETIYCSVQNRHFCSRGFLFGPVCPIYGICIIIVQLLVHFSSGLVDVHAPVWRVFLICTAGSAVVEYTTSWYLEMRFHARWWDYSNLPLNVHGRICLPISLCFGAGGVVIVRYILPVFERTGSRIPLIVWEIAALLLMGVLAADFALTEAELNSLLQRIENLESEFNSRASSVYDAVAGTPQQVTAKVKGIEEEFRRRLYGAASGLSSRQKHIVRNIRSFRPAKVTRFPLYAGQRLKAALSDIRSRRGGAVETGAETEGSGERKCT